MKRTYSPSDNLVYKNIDLDSDKKIIFLSGLGLAIRKQREGFIRRFALTQGISYLALDYTKFAESGGTFKEGADRTFCLLKSSKEKKLYLCGACYGGTMALRMATALPRKIRGVIVSSPACETADFAWIEKADQFLKKRTETLERAKANTDSITKMIAFRQMVIQAFEEQGRKKISPRYQGMLQIFHGQNDRFIPPENSFHVLKSLKNKNATLSLVGKTGHTLASDYEMKGYINVLKEFLDKDK